MKFFLMSIAAGSLLIAAPMAANAQYLMPGGPAPLPSESLPVPGGAVRIQIVDPAAAGTQLNAAAQSGELQQVQAQAAADPAVSAQLATMNIPIANVFEIATDVNGITTVYVMG